MVLNKYVNIKGMTKYSLFATTIRSVQFVCHRSEQIGSTRDSVCRSFNVAPLHDVESTML